MILSQSILGWSVIVVLYATVGAFAAAGSILISQRLFPGKRERVFYGFFLIAIAGFYAAFVSHFGQWESWPNELVAIGVFTAMGIVGAFNAPVLAIGYFLHGVWDSIHELGQNAGVHVLDGTELTMVPAFYGVFCLSYDAIMAVYFLRRRHAWH